MNGTYPELDSLSLSELQARFRAAPPVDPDLEDAAPPRDPDRDSYHDLWYGEVAIAIRKRDPEGGARFLRGEVAVADPERLTAILLAITWFAERDRVHADLLIECLEHPDEHVAAEAIDGLSVLGGCGLTERILALAADPRALVRGAVLRFARRVVPDRAPALLLDGLRDPHYIVRENAVDELDELDYMPALPRIVELSRDPHPHVRSAALGAIANLGPPDAAIALLLGALRDPDVRVRFTAVSQLDQLDRFTDPGVFERMLDDPDEEVRGYTRSILGRRFPDVAGGPPEALPR